MLNFKSISQKFESEKLKKSNKIMDTKDTSTLSRKKLEFQNIFYSFYGNNVIL